MKELLIKIKALFEGAGTDQAKAAVEGIGTAADKAGSGGLGKLQGWIDGAAAKAGIFGGAVSALGASLINFATGAVTGAVSALAGLAQGLVQGIKSATDFADSITETMDKTGQSAQSVLVLGQAFKNAGMGAEAVAPAVNKLQRALAGANEEGAPTAAAFARLGLSIDNLKAQSADQAFAQIGAAISSIKDPTLQAQAAFDIFGRSSVQLLAVLKDSTAFTTAAQQIGGLGTIIGRNGAEMGKFSDAVNALNVKQMQLFAGVASSLVGDLSKAADAMNRINAVPVGQQIGDVLRGVLEWGKALLAANDWVLKISASTRSLAGVFLELSKAVPQLSFFNNLVSMIQGLGETGRRASESAQLQAEYAAAATTQQANLTVDQIRAEAQGKIAQGATAAQTGIAETTAEGQKQLGLTAEQLKAATTALAQAMAQGNTDVVTPAIQALLGSMQEGFARISGEMTSAVTTLAETQKAQTEANQQALREAVSGLADAQKAANAQTQQSIQAAIAAVQQSNQALASAVTSAIGSLQGSLANLQGQINAIASRV